MGSVLSIPTDQQFTPPKNVIYRYLGGTEVKILVSLFPYPCIIIGKGSGKGVHES